MDGADEEQAKSRRRREILFTPHAAIRAIMMELRWMMLLAMAATARTATAFSLRSPPPCLAAAACRARPVVASSSHGEEWAVSEAASAEAAAVVQSGLGAADAAAVVQTSLGPSSKEEPDASSLVTDSPKLSPWPLASLILLWVWPWVLMLVTGRRLPITTEAL